LFINHLHLPLLATNRNLGYILSMLEHNDNSKWLKTIAGDYFSGVILYDTPPKFVLKTALWLLKPGT